MRAVAASPALRATTSFDLLVTAIFAVPGLAEAFIGLISYVGVNLGLAQRIAEFPPMAMFMVNLAGVLGVCWNLSILQTRADVLLRINIVARWFVAALIVYYVAIRGMTPVLLLFVLSEIGGSLVEIRARRLQGPEHAG